jgi:hypothetical protein
MESYYCFLNCELYSNFMHLIKNNEYIVFQRLKLLNVEIVFNTILNIQINFHQPLATYQHPQYRFIRTIHEQVRTEHTIHNIMCLYRVFSVHCMGYTLVIYNSRRHERQNLECLTSYQVACLSIV